MKKTLLFAILSFSLNVFAQSNLIMHQLHHSAATITDNILCRSRDKLLKIPGKSSGINQLQSVRLHQGEENTLIHQIDSTFNWRWDEFVNAWKLNSKIIHVVYDKNNNVTSKTEQGWYHGTWIDSLQYTYSYNAENYLLGVATKNWDGNAWVNTQRETQTFDENHNQTSYALQIWNGSSWDNFLSFTATYTNNKQTSLVWYGGNVFKDSKYTETYDSNNNMITEIFQEWNDILNDWENSSKSVFAYDLNNNLSSETRQIWNSGINNWENSMLHSFTYDAANKKISATDQSWNYNVWENSGKVIYTYDANHNLTKELFLSWQGGAWTNFMQYLHTFDDRDNEVNELDQNWDGSNWTNSAQSIQTFDDRNKQTSELELSWMGSSWVNSLQNFHVYDENGFEKTSSRKTWNYGGTDTVILGDSTYNYYHIVITGMPGLAEDNVLIYPNPAKGKFNIRSSIPISALEIYNLAGKRIYADFKYNQQTSNEIDLSSYSKGVYILKFHSGIKIYNSNVVVQ